MYHILKNTEDNIVKMNLASFIVNNFYCNYLSGNYMENNLLYIITLMLKDEVNKLKNIDQLDSFLENTKCGYLLEEMQKMPDIQIFFKEVIFKTIEKIERNLSFRELSLNINDKQKDLENLKKIEEKKLGKKIDKNLEDFYNKLINGKIFEQAHLRDENSKDKESGAFFSKKYAPNLDIKEIENKVRNAKKDNKKDLFKYYNKLANKLHSNNNPNYYSNSKLMEKMLEAKFPSLLLKLYQNDFLEIISLIEQLTKDLIDNISLLPNSIKYICKVISILIRNKFKDITKIEENAFISKFLLGKLLIPIISFPSSNAIISDFVISGITLKNIKIVNTILKRLFYGRLFKNDDKESNYTPFNWLFFDKMESIMNYFEKVINVNIPSFIDKCANNELPEDYSYDYFEENKEQIYASISISFNVNNVFNLITGLEKGTFFKSNNPKIQKLQKSFEKVNDKENMEEIRVVDIKLLKSAKEKAKERDKELPDDFEIENIFIVMDHYVEKKYEKLFSINNKVANFYIEISKIEKNKKIKLKEEEKIIINVKNYLCSSLGNYRILNKSDFNIGATSNTEKMLNEIKSYMSLPNFILNNNNIPSIWYIDSILDYLHKIPKEYKENDYKKLFAELTNNLNHSINGLDFEMLILFRNKLKFLDKMVNYYKNIKDLINIISTNEKVKKIVEEIPILIDVIFKYDDKEKKFEINKSNFKEKFFEDKVIYEDSKKKIITFKTIEIFTRHFPNLAKYQLMQGINPLDIIKQLSINKKLKKYFEIIKEKVIKTEIKDAKKYDSLYKNKIIDYIMNKIYEKIYPPEPDDKDFQVFKKSMQLSWVEPKLIIEKQDYYFDNILPDILNQFRSVKKSKTPYKKLNCLENILVYISNLIQFNLGIDKKPGQDDVTPVLNYAFIKAHPFGIYTDIEYIKLFLEDYGSNEFSLTNFESMLEYVLNINHETFNLSEEEFNKKCIEAINNSNKKGID